MTEKKLVPLDELIDWSELDGISVTLDNLKRLYFAEGAILTKTNCVTRPNGTRTVEAGNRRALKTELGRDLTDDEKDTCRVTGRSTPFTLELGGYSVALLIDPTRKSAVIDKQNDIRKDDDIILESGLGDFPISYTLLQAAQRVSDADKAEKAALKGLTAFEGMIERGELTDKLAKQMKAALEDYDRKLMGKMG